MRNLLVAFVAMTFAVVGCDSDRHHTRHTTQTQTQKKVQASLLSFEDFDLETVVGLIKQDKVNGAEELEKFINSDNGISNVDTDKDGKLDYIRVVEGRDGQAITLDMVAVGSNKEEVTVANLRFTQNTTSNDMTVEGAYPNYVGGYDSHYYSYHRPHHHGMTAGQAVFLMWLMTPSRSMYMHPVPMYTARPVYSRSQLQTTRATTRTTTKVSPIKNTQRPKNFQVKSAQKTQSRLKKQQAAQFKKRDANRSKPKATGWGAKPSNQKPKATKPQPRRRSTPSRSRSWGGSRGGRRSSIEYKSDVIQLKQGIEIIESLNAVSWNWKNGSKEPDVGFIAEDVAKVMPDLVFHNESGEVEGVNYDLIVVPLVNAVKTQQGQIELLTEELEQLKYDTVQGGVCQP
ncbi:MAG: tail fiber domain-containing protein [Promethearchaeota archaeon]|jgi:hypothetical protein